jgi:hypothetical protein
MTSGGSLMNDTQRRDALSHYHDRYDNDAYNALHTLITWEFGGKPRARTRIMNLIIDACLRMSGWRDAHHARQHHRLMIVLRAYPNLKPLMLAYVRRFHRR